MNLYKKYYCLIAVIGLIIMLTTGCVELKKATLYDGVAPVEKEVLPNDISVIVEPRIYDEDATDVWGLEKDICQEASVSDVAYSGKESLKITWNRDAEGCKWSGIGIGWDNWAGKDLSLIMSSVAIQMYVRTQKGKAFGLPFVLTLIDYSDGMGFLYTTNKYFERSSIDEEWQKVVVPLKDFEITKENLDPSNIKQLQIELQQSGSIYLDDISLVFYEEQIQTPWMEEETLPNPIAMPQMIFDDAFVNNNGWGLVTDDCKTIEWSDNAPASGNKSLHLRWDATREDCKFNNFGVSWNKWHPVDLSSIFKTAAFEFDIKVIGETKKALPIKVGFEDYDRAKAFTMLKPEFVEGRTYSSEWRKVRVPLSAISGTLDLKNIKQVYFQLTGKGAVFMDNFKLINSSH